MSRSRHACSINAYSIYWSRAQRMHRSGPQGRFYCSGSRECRRTPTANKMSVRLEPIAARSDVTCMALVKSTFYQLILRIRAIWPTAMSLSHIPAEKVNCTLEAPTLVRLEEELANIPISWLEASDHCLKIGASCVIRSLASTQIH